nr:serine hydrolase domain-containing protein [Canibacter zhuwentaonis]
MKIGLTVTTVALFALSGCAGEFNAGKGDIKTASETVVAKVDAVVEQVMQSTKSTQAIVGVWLPDGKAYARGYGENVNSSTAIRAAETTSPMMCALVLELAARGELQLDEKISQTLEHESDLENITYAQLCNGTSGIADYRDALREYTAKNPQRPWQINEILAQALANSPLPHAGVNRYLSEADNILIVRAAKIKTAKRTQSLLKDYIYGKIELKDTFYPEIYNSNNELPENSLKPIAYPGGVAEPNCDAEPAQLESVSPAFVPGGASVTTVHDIHSFYTALFGGKFGRAKDFEALNQPASLVNPPRDKDGKETSAVEPVAEGELPHREIVLGATKVGPLRGRAGWLPGTISAAYTDPATGFTMVIALNNSSAGADAADAALLKLAAELVPESQVAVPWSVDAADRALQQKAVCVPAAVEEADEEE